MTTLVYIAKNATNKIPQTRKFKVIATMKVLGMSKLCILYVGLGKENFIPIYGYKVPRLLPRLFILLAKSSFATAQLLISIDRWNDGLHAVLFPLHAMVVFLIKTSIYAVLITKTDQIAEIIDYLQEVVDKRAYSQRIEFIGGKGELNSSFI